MEEPPPRVSERMGVVATDPLRVLGLQLIFAHDPSLEIVPLSVPGALNEVNLSLILIDAQCTEHLFELMSTFKQLRTTLKLIVLGMENGLEYIKRVIGAGAKGYLLLSAQETEICMAVTMVRDGSVWAPRKVLSQLLDVRPGGSRSSVEPAFTKRELQVVRLLQAGHSNREIGLSLGIDEGTVKAHIGRLMRKLGVTNRIALSVHPSLKFGEPE